MSNGRKTRAFSPCDDCGWPTVWRKRPSEWYMVHDEVWLAAEKAADAGLTRFLCIGCLEERLGRELTAADFTGAPVNDPAARYITARLNDRLTTTGERQS